MVIQCSCGLVAVELRGKPIGTVACYCDTCQEGSSHIESLPEAPSVRETDGGTAYVVYRKDRVKGIKGIERLTDYRTEQNPKTNRVVASCCNSALMMRFDDVRHWTPVYRMRFGQNAPPIEMRICTSFAPQNAPIPTDVPSHPGYSGAFMLRLLSSRIAMLFRPA